jgi:hypothetical protein
VAVLDSVRGEGVVALPCSSTRFYASWPTTVSNIERDHSYSLSIYTWPFYVECAVELVESTEAGRMRVSKGSSVQHVISPFHNVDGSRSSLLDFSSRAIQELSVKNQPVLLDGCEIRCFSIVRGISWIPIL